MKVEECLTIFGGSWTESGGWMEECRFEIIKLLFVDDAALVADSKELCTLVREFGRVCERESNVGNSKVNGLFLLLCITSCSGRRM